MAAPQKTYEELLSKSGNAPLSDLLPLLLRLAHILRNKDLDKWIQLEFNGYYNTNPALTEDVKVPEYRTVAGQYFDDSGRPLVITDQYLSFINEDRLRFGISQLEHLLDAGKAVSYRNHVASKIIRQHLNVDVSVYSFSATQISDVLSGIRSKMIEWLHIIEPDINKVINDDKQRERRIVSHYSRKWLAVYMAIIALIGAVAAIMVVPEFRKLLGLPNERDVRNVQGDNLVTPFVVSPMMYKPMKTTEAKPNKQGGDNITASGNGIAIKQERKGTINIAR